ncbi:MAG: hypothetical protein ACJAZR_002493 [Sediminicola sp.]|jgi:hypothetical protein
MKMILKTTLFCACIWGLMIPLHGQKLNSDAFKGLEFRNLGPAFTSGRIADIAIHPNNENIWYVGVGSGGVWKTVNAGTTWSPIFDKQVSYSIGCITIDPNNSHTIWVGSGENVGGRHVGFGDGIYKSIDDGKTWKNLGLKKSEHISKIIVHPKDQDVIWVAVQGPLWSKGGERGVYKSKDGGKTWNKTLGDNDWTGATDILIDQSDPDIFYAATWQRHRTVAGYLGGGPGSGIHKSIDGGETWTKQSAGIPKSNLGKIGLAISPFNSEVIYAAIELDRTKGGLFISTDKGISWTKQSDAISGGTGPHYYQELYASPHKEGRLYLMSNTVQISEDHGKKFYMMNEKNKHVDSHALVFKKSDPNYLLFGTDGGLYETFDHTKTWRFISNLPVTQYYKVAVDDTEPFYNIYGGTQDNRSHGGPSRTTSESGIRNADWWITLGGDGHQSAIEPGNPDITYAESQIGNLYRIDQTTGERVFIQPQPKEGEGFERFNWDAPILVSPHNPSRLYFASQRVWRSENRGDEWTAVSNDLTRNQDRIQFPIMGNSQGWDNAWDMKAMSTYNTITSLSESPKKEGLLYAGTDDGLIQITQDGGTTWKKIELGSISGVPATAFVNDVRADLFDGATVYAVLDNHKYGDFKPYLIKSTDSGASWKLINGDLPNTLLTWRLVQDHLKKDLLFVATEFGIYFTPNGGDNWIQLKGGLPTISFRDITIQRRENDLVAASFGRGFYILDDLSPIREFDQTVASKEAWLFSVKPADWYIEKLPINAQGDADYKAKNPPYGAVFTYYLADSLTTKKQIRQNKEKELLRQNKPIAFPSWEELEGETNELKPEIILVVKDDKDEVVNILKGKVKTGFNRVNWKLTYADRSGEPINAPVKKDGDELNDSNGFLALPGDYSVTLCKRVNGQITVLADPRDFKITRLQEGAIKGADYSEIAEFRKDFQFFQQDFAATNFVQKKCMDQLGAMLRALDKSIVLDEELTSSIYDTRTKLLEIEKQLKGDKNKIEIGENTDPTLSRGYSIGRQTLVNSTYGPTPNHIVAYEQSKNQLKEIKSKLRIINETDIPNIEKALKEAGAPWIEGQGLYEER